VCVEVKGHGVFVSRQQWSRVSVLVERSCGRLEVKGHCVKRSKVVVCLCSGSNGHEYQFLLKGHEDLRQDERVMQLFGLVNSLLLSNPETLRRNLTYCLHYCSFTHCDCDTRAVLIAVLNVHQLC